MALKALKTLTVASAVALAAAGCGSGSPAQPSSAIVGSVGTSFAAAHPISPLEHANVTFASQPVVIAISNGVATGASAVTYIFEVATDSAFANKVFTKEGVVAESGAVTHQSITASLTGGTTYYWHARTNSGGSLGPFSSTASFVLLPQVTLGVPVPVAPAQGATATSSGLQLTVNNVSHTGPVGTIQYRFDIADSSSFSHIVFTGTTPEQSGSTTSLAVTTTLNPGVTYFWRVTATDPGSSVQALSLAVSFQVSTFNLATVIMEASPSTFPTWTQTATITSVEFTDDAFLVDFDRRDSPDRWPDLEFAPGSDETLQYTLGMCLNIPGGSATWYCSAVVQFWYGRDLAASTPPSYVAQNWFYDPARWGPMTGHQPADGETVGLFVATGNLRNRTDNTCEQVCERSNVQLVTWQNGGDTLYTFGSKLHHQLFGR
jgi:hypothetical protein